MKLDIQGQTVEVDDGFAKLSPDEQAATVEDIAKQMNIHAEVKNEVETEAAKPPSAAVEFAQEHPTIAGVAGTAAAPFATALNLAAQHPLEAAGIGFGAYKANKVANAYLNRAQMAAEAQHATAAAQQAQAEAARLQAQADLAAEQGRQGRFNVRQGLPAEVRPVAPSPTPGYSQVTMGQPTYNMPAPQAPAAPAANAMQGAQAAQQGENWMARAVNMAKQAAPTMQQYGARAAQAMAPVGQALAPVGRALAPVAELAARYNPAITGIQALTHSGGLNTNEEEELRRRRAMAPTITR